MKKIEHFEEETTGKPASKDKELHPASEAEGSNRSVLTTLCVSSHSELSGSYGDRLREGFSSRHVRPLENPKTPFANPDTATDAGNVLRMSTKSHAQIPDSDFISRSTGSEGLNHRQKSMWQNFYQIAGWSRSNNLSGGSVFENKGSGVPFSSKEEERKSLDCEEVKPFVTQQKSKGLGGESTWLADDSHKLSMSNQHEDGVDRSKVLSSSSFTKFFIKQTCKDKGDEFIDSKPPSTATTQSASASVEFSVAAADAVATTSQLSSRGMSRLGPISSHSVDGESTCLADSSNNFSSSNQHPDGNDCSKVLSSSSFTKFFTKQTHEHKGAERTSTAITQPASESVKFSAIAVDPMATKGQPSSHSTRLGPVSSHSGIDLREWLNSGTSEVKKAERLHIFRQIVQLVDAAHCKGIILTDLRPSKFLFASLNIIKYTGSFAVAESGGMVYRSATRKRPFELDVHDQNKSGLKPLKLGKDIELTRHHSQSISTYGIFNEAIQSKSKMEADIGELEKKWYACPEELDGSSSFSSNIYGLGVLLFELLCEFGSFELQSAAMLDLRHLILPANFLSGNPVEAGFCFWLLHPEPSSRPPTREILQSELIFSSEEEVVGDAVPSQIEKEEDTESELLLDFLTSLKEEKQNNISTLLENIKCLEADIKKVGKSYEPLLTTASWDDISIDKGNIEVLQRTLLTENLVERNLNLMNHINQLENAYFSLKAQTQMSSLGRPDKALLSDRERCCAAQNADPNMEEKQVDQAVAFFQGLCRFVRYSKFEVSGTLWNSDLLNSTNVICSLSFDRDENYIAAAGVSRKIKIFEFESLLNASLDTQYCMVEMSNRSKLSCVCWNKYIQNYLVSSDYDGVVQLWDASTGEPLAQYIEHQKRAWSVDFSRVDPAKFASGSDDCSVKLWSTTERNSTGTIWNPANVCCVQFSSYSSYLLAFGSADYKIYCYDLRHTKIPWCSLAGHGKAVSYVRFLDSETLVSASTDNTLKLWDLKKTGVEGPITNACSLTFSGHANERNFVGLSVLDGYMACGSESNEVFAYHRSLPMPITSHKFGSIDPISGCEIDDSNGQFVSSVCWRRKSRILVAANSSGSIKLLRMV